MESIANEGGTIPHSSKTFENHITNENEEAVGDDEMEEDGENNQQNTENTTKCDAQDLKECSEKKDAGSSFNASTSFPSVSELIGSASMYDDDENANAAPEIDEKDINNHLKGDLSFGLPTKTGGLTFNRPYRLVGRKSKGYIKVKYQNRAAKMKKQRKVIANNRRNHIAKKTDKLMEGVNIDHLSDELKLAYRIVTHLMSDSLKSSNSIFMETIEMDPSINGDYLEVVNEPIWLPKIKNKLLANEYKSMTEVISQIRLMFENTYRYFGAGHSFSKRGLRMEYALEQKIAQLPEDTKSQCTLEATHDLLTDGFSEATRTKGCCIKVNGETYFSYLMFNVRGCRAAREKELRRRKFDMMRQAKQTREVELAQWEENLTNGSLGGPIKHMWELVHINQFLYLSMKMLNITPISQYELERVLMVPESSMTLRMIMTALLLPKQQRAKLGDKPHMPYLTWVRRLASKTVYWYRMLVKESHDVNRVRDQLGIEPRFWQVCGSKNPFDFKLFHEMTLYQRVWLLKALCDNIYHTHKSIQECITEQDEENLETMREEVLGRDRQGFEYIHFPQFKMTDVRIYKRVKHRYTDPDKQDKSAKTKNDETFFSKNEIKSFQKYIKKLKKKRNTDEDWEKEVGRSKFRLTKRRNRRRGSYSAGASTAPSSSNTPGTSQQDTPRTRPRWLRQTPKPRYSIQIDSDSEGRADSPYQPRGGFASLQNSKKRKKAVVDDSPPTSPPSLTEEESDIDEGFKEDSELDDEIKEQKTESKQKTRRGKSSATPKQSDGPHKCDLCERVFASRAARCGHMGTHKRKKEKASSAKSLKTDNKMTMETTEGVKKEEIESNHAADENQEESKSLDEPGVKNVEEKNEASKIKEENLTEAPDNKEQTIKMEVKEDNSETDESKTTSMADTKPLSTGTDELIASESKASVSVEREEEPVVMKESLDDGNAEKENITKGDSDIQEQKVDQINEVSPSTENSDEKSNSIEVKPDHDTAVSSMDIETNGKTLDNSENTAQTTNEKNVDSSIRTEQQEKSENSICPSDEPEIERQEQKIEKELVKDIETPNNLSSKDQLDVNTTEPLVDGGINSRCSTPSDDSSTTGVQCDVKKPTTKSSADLKEPDSEEFELVASSFAELRNLIQVFGQLPLKYAKEKPVDEGGNSSKEEELDDDQADEEMNNEKEIEEEKDSEKQIGNEDDQNVETDKKVPRCEEKLHKALCNLLIEWAPFENRMKGAQKQMKKKLWNEYLEWSKRDENFVDPGEEAWNSDPEPEQVPTPSATQTPKPSSSSSSEDTYNDDGTRKRKLRKRKAKRVTIDQESRTPSPELVAPSPPPSPVGRVAVSSRGRVRKVKRIMNYDRMDFEKLAEQAEKDAETQREKKRKRKEDNDIVSGLVRLQELREKIRLEKKEKTNSPQKSQNNDPNVLEEAAQSLSIPSSGVKRYIISKTGQVIGYIGNDGQIHTGLLKKKDSTLKQNESISKNTPRDNKPIGTKVVPDKIPKVVLSAVNQMGNPVYVRMVGNQALELMKIIKDAKAGPPRQIKLQRFSQTYTFNTNSEVLTQNIPGYPDCDTSNPLLLSQVKTTTTTTKTPTVSSPSKESESTSEEETKYTSKGVVAQAIESALSAPPRLYENQSIAVPTSLATSLVSVAKQTAADHPVPSTSSASLSASTRLVFASQSTVPSVPPIAPISNPTISESSTVNSPNAAVTPLLIQTENGKQLQIGLNEKLSQIVQKTGQRIVAVPNNKGGYTISLVSSSNPQQPAQGANVAKSPPSVSPVNTVIRNVTPRSVPTQVIPFVPSNIMATNSGVGTVVRTQKVETQPLSPTPQQHIVSNFSVSPQILSNSSIGRQQILIQPTSGQNLRVKQCNTTPGFSKVHSSNQVVQIAQGQPNQVVQIAQPQPQVVQINQQGTQKIVQIIPSSMAGRQLIHMVQPGQVFMAPNSVAVVSGGGVPSTLPSTSTGQQNVIHFAQQPQQSLQQQVIPQPSQSIQIQQDHQSHLNTVHLQHQQPVDHETDPLQLPTEPVIQLPKSVVPQIRIQTQPSIQQQIYQKPQTSISAILPHQPNPTPTSEPKAATKSQVGRLLIVQTNEGQKVCLQLADGKLSVLTPEQLQPFIASGAIKVNSS